MKRTAPLRSDHAKTRDWLERSRTELKRTPLERHTPIAPVNQERKARLREEQFGEDGAYAAWLRTQPCVCCGRWERDRMHCHHVLSRARGGSERDMVPLLFSCHDAGHTGGWQTFERTRGVDLRMEADRLWLRWAAWTAERPTMGPRRV